MRLFGVDHRPLIHAPARGLGKSWAVQNAVVSRTPERFVRISGAAGTYVSTPDSTTLSIVGDLDLRVRVRLDDYTPSALQILIAKDGVDAGERSYMFYIDTDGTLVYGWSILGTILITKASTTATGLADGTMKWLRVTHDVDNGAAGNDVAFYMADINSSYSQLGTTVTTAGTTSIADTVSVVTIGANNAGADNRAVGNFYEAEIYSGIAGTRVASFDAALAPVGAGTLVGRHGELWTMQGAAYIGT